MAQIIEAVELFAAPVKTEEILAATAEQPLHLLPREEVCDQRVSSRSFWRDRIWHLDNSTHGASSTGAAVSWDLKLSIGGNLTDPEYADTLDWAKRLVWSAFAAPGDGAGRLKPGSAGHFSAGIRYLLDWMIRSHLSRPSELDRQTVRAYVDEIAAEFEDEEGGSELSISQASTRLNPLLWVWRQRFVLERAGVPSPPEHPFAGDSINAVASEIAKRARGWFRPLPDQVAVPVINTAMSFIDVPARDIIALRDQAQEAFDRLGTYHSGDGSSVTRRSVRQREVICAYQFTSQLGRAGPWHPRIEADAGNRLRRLVVSLQYAAALVIQATTGMRISEVCGLKSGLDEGSGLPKSVQIRIDDSGLFETFLLETHLSKTRQSPEPVTWVLGKRLVESEDLPPAVKAMVVLERLMAPYREMAGLDDLLLTLERGGLPRSPKSVRRMTADRLRNGYKNFLEEWVDLSQLPDTETLAGDLVEYRETKGRCIKSHQFRKLFANFILKVDGALLPVLSQHFQHLSLAMTEDGYSGNREGFLQDRQDITTQMMAAAALELVNSTGKGAKSIAGRFGRAFADRVQKSLLPALEGGDSIERRQIATEWVEENRFTEVFPELHGICGALTASKMACHESAGTADLARWRPKLAPNYEAREPGMCSGCQSFMVLRHHLQFWESRYVDHMVSVRQFQELKRRGAVPDRFPDSQYVLIDRAQQALNLCRGLGANIEELDRRVDQRVKETFDGQAAE